MQKGNRNPVIELWRIVFCLVILGFHFFSKLEMEYFHAGYLGVEFFFLLSGWALYGSSVRILTKNKISKTVSGIGSRENESKVNVSRVNEETAKNDPSDEHQEKAVKNRVSDWFGFAKKRMIRLYPLYFCSMLCMLLVKVITKQVAFPAVMGYCKSCLAEFFFLQCSPLGNEVMIAANWYVAVLFWGSLLWMAVLLLVKKPAALFAAPIASILIYGYYFRLIGKIDVIFSYHAFLRGLAGISLGIFLGALTDAVNAHRSKTGIFADKDSYLKPDSDGFSDAAGKIKTVLGCLILAGCAVYTNFGHRSRWDYLIIALYFLALFLILTAYGGRTEVSTKHITDKNTDPKSTENGKTTDISRKIQKAASFTYPVYLFQMPVIELIKYMLGV